MPADSIFDFGVEAMLFFQDPIPSAPSWPWIVGGILLALTTLAGVIKLLYSRTESSQTALVTVLNKEIDRRDKADERRDNEMKQIIATHENLGKAIVTAINKSADRQEAQFKEFVTRFRERQ